jgi:hypothetical protein
VAHIGVEHGDRDGRLPDKSVQVAFAFAQPRNEEIILPCEAGQIDRDANCGGGAFFTERVLL